MMRAKEGGEKGKMKGKVGRMKEGRKDVTSGKMRNYLSHLYNTCGLHSIENFSQKSVYFLSVISVVRDRNKTDLVSE